MSNIVGTVLDTNVILDVLLPDPKHADASVRAIDEAARIGALSVGPVTFAELVTVFARKHGHAGAAERVTSFLSEAGISIAAWHPEAAETAGLAYAKHLGRRETASVECPSCGVKGKHACASCGRTVSWRAHIMTDFLIGAHARHSAGRILTRDPHLHGKIAGLVVVVP